MNIKARLPKGYYYEILKILKKCHNDSEAMHNYYMYNKRLFWRGRKAAAYPLGNTKMDFCEIAVNIPGGLNFPSNIEW